MVGNERVVLAGVGVALCDSRDNLVFEVWKPLIGNGMSKNGALLKALIEGLNAGLALDLTRITFFCLRWPVAGGGGRRRVTAVVAGDGWLADGAWRWWLYMDMWHSMLALEGGTLNNGKVVAVKKLAILQSDRAKANFVNEVKLMSNVHHRNLILLLGCCSKGPQLLLIYEYMANNRLYRCIFGPKRGSLNWKQLNDIILGTARGLAYLHEEFHVCIIHRDIKTSNILLDDSFQPKINFGLARLLPDDQTHLISTRSAGTL
ncbi:PREDICTED: cysteine-rich [Prunus dulcis]|uniref:non-specific serine/threonine protein kinase n=1 Tax=Prunus dulcis TaxID=3755 RepID=A0A5E4F0D1_PRUDU|nr:PREDICTED: cysteine-rich [Prunus dulcis]